MGMARSPVTVPLGMACVKRRLTGAESVEMDNGAVAVLPENGTVEMLAA